MKNCSFEYRGRNYKRVSKKAALNLWLSDRHVYISPLNYVPADCIPPEYMSAFEFLYYNDNIPETVQIDYYSSCDYFYDLVDFFESLYCNSKKTGRYAAFYVAI